MNSLRNSMFFDIQCIFNVDISAQSDTMIYKINIKLGRIVLWIYTDFKK